MRTYRKKYVYRRKRRHGGRRTLTVSNRVTPQYVLKPRLTTRRLVNVPFSNNFRQKYFSQTGSGRRRYHKKRVYRKRHGGYHKKRVYHKRRHGGSILSHIHSFVKGNKLASKAASYAIKHGPSALKGVFKAAHTLATHHGYGRRHHKRRHYHKHGRGIGHVGYGRNIGSVYSGDGRRRRRHHKRRGGAIDGGRRRRRRGGSFLSKINDFLKKTQIGSKIGHTISDILPGHLRELGHSASKALEHYGYGYSRKRGRGIGQVGGLFTTPLYPKYGYGRRHRRKGRGTPYPFISSV